MAIRDISFGLRVQDKEPIDSRMVVADQAARLAIPTSFAYEGLIVYQEDNNNVYVLTVDEGSDQNSNWVLVGGENTTPNDSTITLAAGTGLTGGGAFTTDQSTNETITLTVDTGTGLNKIPQITDSNGLSSGDWLRSSSHGIYGEPTSTVQDTLVTTAAVESALSITESGEAQEFLNEQGDFVAVTGLSDENFTSDLKTLLDNLTLPDGDGETREYLMQVTGSAGDETYSWRVSSGEYVLPTATASILGGVRVPDSSDIRINGDGDLLLKDISATKLTSGVIDVSRMTTDTPSDGQYLAYQSSDDTMVWSTVTATVPRATSTVLGGVLIPDSSDIDVDNLGNITLGDLDADKITSGVLDRARISTDTPTANQVLTWDGTNNVMVWDDGSSHRRTIQSGGADVTDEDDLNFVSPLKATQNTDDDRIDVEIDPASSTAAGIVSIGAQTFSGNKVFNDNLTVNSELVVNGPIVLGDAAADAIEVKGDTIFENKVTLGSSAGDEVDIIASDVYIPNVVTGSIAPGKWLGLNDDNELVIASNSGGGGGAEVTWTGTDGSNADYSRVDNTVFFGTEFILQTNDNNPAITIKNATTSQAGMVSLTTQSFGGPKSFQDAVSFQDVINIFDSASDPTGTQSSGALYYNTDTDVLRVNDGSNWNEVGAPKLSSIINAYGSWDTGESSSPPAGRCRLVHAEGEGTSTFADGDAWSLMTELYINHTDADSNDHETDLDAVLSNENAVAIWQSETSWAIVKCTSSTEIDASFTGGVGMDVEVLSSHGTFDDSANVNIGWIPGGSGGAAFDATADHTLTGNVVIDPASGKSNLEIHDGVTYVADGTGKISISLDAEHTQAAGVSNHTSFYLIDENDQLKISKTGETDTITPAIDSYRRRLEVTKTYASSDFNAGEWAGRIHHIIPTDVSSDGTLTTTDFFMGIPANNADTFGGEFDLTSGLWSTGSIGTFTDSLNDTLGFQATADGDMFLFGGGSPTIGIYSGRTSAGAGATIDFKGHADDDDSDSNVDTDAFVNYAQIVSQQTDLSDTHNGELRFSVAKESVLSEALRIGKTIEAFEPIKLDLSGSNPAPVSGDTDFWQGALYYNTGDDTIRYNDGTLSGWETVATRDYVNEGFIEHVTYLSVRSTQQNVNPPTFEYTYDVDGNILGSHGIGTFWYRSATYQGKDAYELVFSGGESPDANGAHYIQIVRASDDEIGYYKVIGYPEFSNEGNTNDFVAIEETPVVGTDVLSTTPADNAAFQINWGKSDAVTSYTVFNDNYNGLVPHPGTTNGFMDNDGSWTKETILGYSLTDEYAVGDIIVYNSQIYQCDTALSAATAWAANTSYETGDNVTNGGIRYRSISGADSGATFVSGNWLEVTPGTESQAYWDVLSINNASGSETYLLVNSTGTAPSAGGTDAIAIGENSDAPSTNSIAIGNSADITSGSNGIAIGTDAILQTAALTTTDNHFAANALAGSGRSIAIGQNALAGGGSAIAIGGAAASTGATTAWGNDAIAIGEGATSRLSGAISIGRDADAYATDSVAIGAGAVAEHTNSMAIGSGATARAANVATIGDTDHVVELGRQTASDDNDLAVTTKKYVEDELNTSDSFIPYTNDLLDGSGGITGDNDAAFRETSGGTFIVRPNRDLTPNPVSAGDTFSEHFGSVGVLRITDGDGRIYEIDLAAEGDKVVSGDPDDGIDFNWQFSSGEYTDIGGTTGNGTYYAISDAWIKLEVDDFITNRTSDEDRAWSYSDYVTGCKYLGGSGTDSDSNSYTTIRPTWATTGTWYRVFITGDNAGEEIRATVDGDPLASRTY